MECHHIATPPHTSRGFARPIQVSAFLPFLFLLQFIKKLAMSSNHERLGFLGPFRRVLSLLFLFLHFIKKLSMSSSKVGGSRPIQYSVFFYCFIPSIY